MSNFFGDDVISNKNTNFKFKTMRVFMDNGVEKVISSPGTAADVIIVNTADGTKAAYKNFSGFSGNFQDVELGYFFLKLFFF